MEFHILNAHDVLGGHAKDGSSVQSMNREIRRFQLTYEEKESLSLEC